MVDLYSRLTYNQENTVHSFTLLISLPSCTVNLVGVGIELLLSCSSHAFRIAITRTPVHNFGIIRGLGGSSEIGLYPGVMVHLRGRGV